MFTPRLRPLVLAVLTATLSLQAVAALDEVQVRMLQSYTLPLRWDNVERAPQWVNGVQTAYRSDQGLHVVRLAPGEAVTLRVAGGQQVRVWRVDGTLGPADLEMDFSAGSGLYQSLPAALSADHRGMLSRTQMKTPYLARISRPRQSSSTLEVALFISRHEPMGELAPYRGVIDLPGTVVQMRREDQAASQAYWNFIPQQPLEVRVKGPARYAFEHRYVYAAKESGLAQTYRVHARIDGHALANLEFETSAESAYPVYVNRHARVMGRSEVGYLEIPPGDHLLRLDSTAPLIGRLLLQEQTDYLFPALNEPVRTTLQVREQDEPFRLAISGQSTDVDQSPSRPVQESRSAPVPLPLRLLPWPSQPAGLEKSSHNRALTPVEQESAALRIARDNARQEGGLLSAMLMQESAKQNPDYPAVHTLASELLGSHSFYRDLLPRENLTAAGQYFARYIPRNLHAFGDQGRGITQGEQHLQELLDRISGAYFTDIPVHIRSSKIDVQVDGQNLKLTLPADVLFDTDKSVLKPRFQSLLEEAAALILSRHPQQIRVIGHTDSRASEKHNQRLSERRAQAVAAFLARNGINASILHSLGKGELQPRASNDSVSGRQSNRRVEIMLEGAQKSVVPPQEKFGYHRYVLPARVEPSLLRVVVDAPVSDESEFLLQFDEDEPIRMRVVAGQELPVDEYAPTQGDAALEILAHQFGGENASVTDGPYSARRVPGKLVRARLMDIPLPSQVHEVRVWRSENSDHPVHVALQYRAAKPFVLSESEYLEMAARTGDSAQVLGVFARTLKSATAAESDSSAQELGNHWLPLVRSLRSGYKVFSAPVVAPQIPVGTAQLGAEQLSRLRAEAQTAEREGRWSSALDVWGDLVRRAPIPLREEAMLAQAEALLHLGEDYLAEQQLRSLSLYAGEPAIRQRACERLGAFYRSNGDTASQVLLWGSLSVQKPDVLNLRLLAESLVENSEHQLALEVGLLLPESEQPHDHLLRAAYQLGWWSVYQRLAASIEPAEPRAVWQGLSAMSQGHISQARVHFSAGGDQGKAWLTALNSGAALVQQLHRHSSLEDSDVDAWQHWHSAHPGPFAWREEAQLITDFAGSETLYSVDRDAYSRAYLATPSKPVRLRLMGPLRLNIESRPVHTTKPAQPVNGWLRLKEANGMRVLPISNNVPATGLELVGRSDLKPGRTVSGVFDFGPGVHEVELDAGNLPVLLRVLARRPEMAIPLAPALYEDSLISSTATPSLAEHEHAFTCWWKNCAVLVPPKEAAAAYRRNLRLDQVPAKQSQPQKMPAGTLIQQEPLLSPAGERMPGMAWPEGEKLATGDVEAALAMHPGNNESDALRRMTLLLWWSEQNPAMHQRALIDAEALGARYPTNVALQSMLSRLSRDALWQPATGIQDSAGQRYLEVVGWQPESTALRARKALMREFAATDQIVSGNGRLVFSLRNLRTSPVELLMSHENVSPLAPLPLKALYQLDGGAPVAVMLSPSQPLRKVRLAVPAGDHLIRVWIEAPMADQFLRVNLVDRGPAVPMAMVERAWYVASRREPLRVAVAGPAWLLIDELRDGKVESRYQWVSTDFEELVLTPSGQRAESLYRIHQRSVVPGSSPILPRIVEVPTDPVPPAYARIETTEASRKVVFRDGFQLGGQEDGTWSYSAQLAKRRDPQSTASGKADKFLQLSVTHRYYDEDRRTYFRTDMLGRVRDAGGPSLGLLESIEYQPVWSTLNFGLDAGLYLQRPDGGLSVVNNEWSAFLKGSVSQKRDIDLKSYHAPKLSLFARDFSMHSVVNYAAEKVDQDVYTSYKSTHKHGLELSDTLYHRPWLDTLWYAGGSLVSNEDINVFQPDHLGFKVGWQQLLGNVQLDASYQPLHYYSDNLRTNASTQRTWMLNASWNQWNGQQDRLEAGVQLRHDSDTGAVTAMLYFTWHDSNGRRYRDFRSGDVDFRDLRNRTIPATPNNAVKESKDD